MSPLYIIHYHLGQRVGEEGEKASSHDLKRSTCEEIDSHMVSAFFCHCTNSLYTCILNKCSSIHILKRTENIQGRLKIMIRNKELPLKKGEKLYFVLLKEQLKGDIVGDLIKPRVLQQT